MAALEDERYPLAAVLERLGPKPTDISGVEVDLLAWLAADTHRRSGRPCIVITPGAADARRIGNDLSFFGGASGVISLPHVEASPYGHLSPDRSAVMELMANLAKLVWDDTPGHIVLSVEALARKVMPKDVLLDYSFLVTTGEDLDRGVCLRALADGGYHSVSTVVDPGTFAVRGGIIDVFPPHLDQPVRIELFGDEVESIRPFNPESQRANGAPCDALFLPPVREELLCSPFNERARRGILEAGGAAGVPTRQLQPMLDDLSNAIPFMGMEGFRPAFYEDGLGSLAEYLPEDAVVFLFDPMEIGDRLRGWWERLSAGHAECLRTQQPSLAAEQHSLSPSEIAVALARWPQIRAHTLQMVDELGAIEGPDDAIRFQVPTNADLSHALTQCRGDKEPLRPLAEAVREWTEHSGRVAIVCRQTTQLERVERLLKGYGVPTTRGDQPAPAYLSPDCPISGAVLLRGDVGGGFRLLSHGFALLTEEEIFGAKSHKRRSKRRTGDGANPFVQNFRELEDGDYIVHADHGIGRYIGLKKVLFNGIEQDFLELHFAKADKLYLPVYKLGRLQKYMGGKSAPKIDRLGGASWQKVRGKAQKSAEEDAYVLLDLYAKRELATGYAFSPPDDYFRSFEGTFPFVETPDQARAIEEVIDDMTRARPMDRLLCGDVGFGKTEVALRAAMKAIVDGKQVALLVPTTVLSLQHFKTIVSRFSPYPITVGHMSRLTTAKQHKVLLKQLRAGTVDIVVGTHRLLSKDIEFADLGLLILDEEHRFGVKHKERLKEVRASVDVLSMTATPIPRTLQMSLSGLRDLSVITTPPSDRLSVRTFVCRSTDQVVRDAIIRELGRGGQVFFVHNRVHSIEARQAWLQSLVPEARIIIGHGQMDPHKLEQVMVDFTEGRFNVLLSTTIIESGIDIPTANTMLVDHADHFGLAQLYQLRGRVGRSKERGYCYLLVPSESTLTPEARKRLAVIQKFTELGSGFHVASHDMELRGAGEVLGTRQKGQMQAVGLDLYAQLLEEAVGKLRGEPAPVEFDPDINVKINARLPEDFVPDTHLRLVLYKRLANAIDEEAVLAIAEEMEDRFGALPGTVENLVELMRIRALGRHVGLNAVDLTPDRLALVFHPQSPMPVPTIIELVSAPNTQFSAPADFKLNYHFTVQERHDTVGSARNCLQRLAEFVTEDAA